MFILYLLSLFSIDLRVCGSKAGDERDLICELLDPVHDERSGVIGGPDEAARQSGALADQLRCLGCDCTRTLSDPRAYAGDLAHTLPVLIGVDRLQRGSGAVDDGRGLLYGSSGQRHSGSDNLPGQVNPAGYGVAHLVPQFLKQKNFSYIFFPKI